MDDLNTDSTGDTLVTDLSRPDSYPPPRPDSVTVISTHISWVFLAGDTAWKVKRPVSLGFLDFSTQEQRRHFCQLELELNQRLAPGVYQAVVPVFRTSGGHTLAPDRGAGIPPDDPPIVDYAVKMRRLPDDRSAAALLRTGLLGHDHLAALASRLAGFYAKADSATQFGSPAVLVGNIEENLQQLQRFAGDVLDPDRLAEVGAAQRRDLKRHDRSLHERQLASKVRDGHGDLRLEHVYFLDDRSAPLIIDCLEFNQRFRCADVALDVAFFVMELRAAGRTDLAEYFAYRFARESNDYDLYPLLDFYAAYRALVRVKVACLLASGPGVPAGKRQRKRREAQDLLALTQALENGSPARPAVLAVGGLVGTGKSTLSEAVARNLGIATVSSDLTRKSLAGLAATEAGGPEIYTSTFTDRTYAELIRRAGQVLASGRSVILDATFRTAGHRRLARDLAAARDARFLFVETTCDETTLRARLRDRAESPTESDADERVLEHIRNEFGAPDELPGAERLQADTRRPISSLVEDIRTWVTDGSQTG